MKHLKAAIFALVSMICFLAVSCGSAVTYYKPVYRALSDVRSAVALLPEPSAPSVEGLGKIVRSPDGQFLFVNEMNKGVRVASLKDPAAPVWLGFIEIPGNIDIAFLGVGGKDYLYADSFVDLVILELTLPYAAGDVLAASEVGRKLNVFPNNPYQWFAGSDTSVWFGESIPADMVVVGYTSETRIQWTMPGVVYAMADSVKTGGSGGAGAAGSMARFALHQDSANSTWYLYTVDSMSLNAYSLTNPVNPSSPTSTNAGWSIETIFPYKDALFLGSASALYIYNIADSPDSSPLSPVKLATLEHFTARDPVVVGPVGPVGGEKKDTAFVTLSEDRWGWGTNQLIAVDVSDLTKPLDIVRKTMSGPRGLGLLGDTLFVTEGAEGVKVLDVSNVRDAGANLVDRLKETDSIPSTETGETYDLIPGDDFLIVAGPAGISLWTYDAVTKKLSKLGALSISSAN